MDLKIESYFVNGVNGIRLPSESSAEKVLVQKSNQ